MGPHGHVWNYRDPILDGEEEAPRGLSRTFVQDRGPSAGRDPILDGELHEGLNGGLKR